MSSKNVSAGRNAWHIRAKPSLYNWDTWTREGEWFFPSHTAGECSQPGLLTPSPTYFLLHHDNGDLMCRCGWGAGREQQNQGQTGELNLVACHGKLVTVKWKHHPERLRSALAESVLSWWTISRAGVRWATSLGAAWWRVLRQAAACPEMEEHPGWWADQKHVFEENSEKWGSLTRKREEWTQGLIQIFERPSYGQANKHVGCSPGQNKAGSNGEECVFYSKTDLVLIPPLTLNNLAQMTLILQPSTSKSVKWV